LICILQRNCCLRISVAEPRKAARRSAFIRFKAWLSLVNPKVLTIVCCSKRYTRENSEHFYTEVGHLVIGNMDSIRRSQVFHILLAGWEANFMMFCGDAINSPCHDDKNFFHSVCTDSKSSHCICYIHSCCICCTYSYSESRLWNFSACYLLV